MKEFNLSERMHDCPELLSEVIRERDVREFIKQVKEIKCFGWKEFVKELDKLAGEKLK